MKSDVKELGKAVGKLIVGCAACLLNAYTITVLWAWFVVTVFGVPALSVVAVLGLHLLYRVFTHNHRVETELVEDGFVADLASIVVSLLALGVGYIIHLGM